MNDFSVSVSIELTQEAYPEGYPEQMEANLALDLKE